MPVQGNYKGLIVMRTFIPYTTAAGGTLLGDARGFSLDPNASYRVAVAWNTATGEVSYTVSPSHETASKGGYREPPRPVTELPALPIKDDGANHIWLIAGPGPAAGGFFGKESMEIKVGGIQPLWPCCSVNYSVAVSATDDSGHFDVRLRGTQYPDFEATAYSPGKAPTSLARYTGGGGLNAVPTADDGDQAWRDGRLVGPNDPLMTQFAFFDQ